MVYQENLGGLFGPLKMRPKGGVIVAPLETFRRKREVTCPQQVSHVLCIYIYTLLYKPEERAREAKPWGVGPKGDAQLWRL